MAALVRPPRLLTLLAAVLVLAPAALRAQDAGAAPRPLPPHPRLLVTDAELKAAITAAGSDPVRAAVIRRVVAAAESDLKAPPIEHKLIGPRMLAQSRRAIETILTSAMAYRLTGDARFAERARGDLLTVAAFPDWNPSHFLDVAEMSVAVGVGYDWLYAWLPAADRATIRQALLDKALRFAPAAYAGGKPADPRLFWAAARMNWNQVCNGGLLTASLAIAEDHPEFVRTVVAGVRATLPLATEAYEPDGAYPEGPAYWAYGTTYNVIILSELEGVLGTDFGLGDGPGFRQTARYRLEVEGPTGLCFNYADGGAQVEDTPAYAWLALRDHLPQAVAHSRALLAAEAAQKGRNNDRFLALSPSWFPPAGPPGGPDAPLAVHFRGAADLALFRSRWADREALFVGFKAGDNRTNHAHLDLGSFVLDAEGVRWAVNLGPDDYNLPGYFGKERWSYFRLNNRGQSTVTPDDALQDPKAVAAITAFATQPGWSYAIADLSGAYPNEATRMRRGLGLVGDSSVVIRDEVEGLKSGAVLHWAMITQAAVRLDPNLDTAVLTERGHALWVKAAWPAGARFHVEAARPPSAQENQNQGTEKLVLEVPRAGGTTSVVVILALPGAHSLDIPSMELGPLAQWR